MRNTILSIVAVVVIAAAAYVFFSGSTVQPAVSPSAQPAPSTPAYPSQPSPAVVPPAGSAAATNSVAVSDQPSGPTVTIASVTLDKPGFVAIHESQENAPGKVVGVSALIPAGTTQSVVIAVNPVLKVGASYFAMLHRDNGNGTYEFPGPDVPVNNANGQIAMMKFTVQAAGTSTGVKTGVKTDVNVDASVVAPPVAASASVTLSMASGNFFFRPSQLKVKEGQTVTINFTNSGFHTFTIDELGVNTTLSGDNGSVTFVASKKGTFEYYCAVGSHRAMGMKGTLVVE